MSKTDWSASKVEMRSVSELVPYANNSRTHSPHQGLKWIEEQAFRAGAKYVWSR